MRRLLIAVGALAGLATALVVLWRRRRRVGLSVGPLTRP